ncbi:hypothetical protein [Actinomadura macrotermitis]|uniref:Uncharacterized protein n=1 Tax=Actinomadura macrotermitis TaxID=2585200 RepID=A0A7K0C4A9_9ACTN|nr:hypothetical protein [Actinomadura macrotermitis]MQY08273.1 hypothetical protein [Actinomadura macrotermitis]
MKKKHLVVSVLAGGLAVAGLGGAAQAAGHEPGKPPKPAKRERIVCFDRKEGGPRSTGPAGEKGARKRVVLKAGPDGAQEFQVKPGEKAGPIKREKLACAAKPGGFPKGGPKGGKDDPEAGKGDPKRTGGK